MTMQLMLRQCGLCGWATFDPLARFGLLQDYLGDRYDICNDCLTWLEKRRGMYKLTDLSETDLIVKVHNDSD
jgi:hypothetical protein